MEQSRENAVKVLGEVSCLDETEKLAQLILSMYQRLLDGADMGTLRREADKRKAESLKNVI